MVAKLTRNHQHSTAVSFATSSLVLVAWLCVCSFAPPAGAEITTSGDVDPNDPNTWTSSTSVYIGKTGSGTLNVANGGAVSSYNGFIGSESGSTGVVTVDGAGSTWTNSSILFVGYAGSGTLNVTNGGAVSSSDGDIGFLSGSMGEVTVDGASSTWTNSGNLDVGFLGNGMLNITNGGAVSNVYGDIGNKPGSTGEVTVDGASSTWTNTSRLSVGSEGNGTLNITNGGTVSNNWGYIGNQPGSTGEVTVDGLGSTWTNDGPASGPLYIGHEGIGTLHITSGGAVSNGVGFIGYRSGSTGEVTVDGAGSTWTTSVLYVGDNGSGTLNITNGGSVSISTTSDIYSGIIGFESGSTGVVTVDGPGSTLTSSNSIYVGYEGNGTLNIMGGGAASNNTFGVIGSYSGSTGVVTVDGAGSTWTNGSDLYVGYYGSGTLNITNGGLVSVAGRLIIDYDGDSYINMATGGMLALSGQAESSLNDFLNLIAGTDAICYWDASIADWADITGATYGEDYTLSYLAEGDLASYTLLTVAAAIMGDADNSGYVDDDDLSLLLSSWHQNTGWGHGEFSGDSYVDDDDLSLLLTNWHAGTPPAAGELVPEPATLVLLSVGVLPLLRRRRK